MIEPKKHKWAKYMPCIVRTPMGSIIGTGYFLYVSGIMKPMVLQDLKGEKLPDEPYMIEWMAGERVVLYTEVIQ